MAQLFYVKTAVSNQFGTATLLGGNISRLAYHDSDSLVAIDTLSYNPVPEHATMFLLGTGLVGVAGAARRKKKNQA